MATFFFFKALNLWKTSRSHTENTIVYPEAMLLLFFLPLCPLTAWMLSINVWTWTRPTRNGLTDLTRQVTLTGWPAGGQELFVPDRRWESATQHLQSKVLQRPHKPCLCDFTSIFPSHKPIAYCPRLIREETHSTSTGRNARCAFLSRSLSTTTTHCNKHTAVFYQALRL